MYNNCGFYCNIVTYQGRAQCTVGLEGGSRRHSTVRQPDSQGSQTVFLVAPCCSDLTVVYANDVLVYGLTLHLGTETRCLSHVHESTAGACKIRHI